MRGVLTKIGGSSCPINNMDMFVDWGKCLHDLNPDPSSTSLSFWKPYLAYATTTRRHRYSESASMSHLCLTFFSECMAVLWTLLSGVTSLEVLSHFARTSWMLMWRSSSSPCASKRRSRAAVWMKMVRCLVGFPSVSNQLVSKNISKLPQEEVLGPSFRLYYTLDLSSSSTPCFANFWCFFGPFGPYM